MCSMQEWKHEQDQQRSPAHAPGGDGGAGVHHQSRHLVAWEAGGESGRPSEHGRAAQPSTPAETSSQCSPASAPPAPSWKTRLFRMATMLHMRGPVMMANVSCNGRERRGRQENKEPPGRQAQGGVHGSGERRAAWQPDGGSRPHLNAAHVAQRGAARVVDQVVEGERVGDVAVLKHPARRGREGNRRRVGAPCVFRPQAARARSTNASDEQRSAPLTCSACRRGCRPGSAG